MEIDKINKILKDFYNGEATAEDEQTLLQYFNSNNVAEELLNEKEFFLEAYYATSEPTPSALESKLNALIDELADSENKTARVINLKKKKKLIWIGSIAASLILMIGIGHYFINTNRIDGPTIAKTINNDEQKQMEEAQKALVLLSSNFNKGIDQLSLVSENISKTNGILDKTLKRKNDKE